MKLPTDKVLENGESSQDVSYWGSRIDVKINIFKDIKDYFEEKLDKLSIAHDELTKRQRDEHVKNISWKKTGLNEILGTV